MDLGEIIAANLKELRAQRNLSLGQLAKLSGISKAILSDLEKGAGNPTINTIWKIANGLNVPYTKLMDRVENEATLVRLAQTAVQYGQSEHYRVHCYFPSTSQRNFELFYVELDPESSNASIGHSQRAQEYIYLLEGELEVHTGSEDYTLAQGDALLFDSSLSHVYRNRREAPARFLVINYYP